jgi:acyl-CoA synthetase (AMP-forming)/AMP-acid ligase II
VEERYGELIRAIYSGENEFGDFVGKRIARYKKPKYVEFVADFPVLEDGSPDRAKTKKLYGGV